MCDVAYALLVEQITAKVLAAQQAAAVYEALGGQVTEWPDLGPAIAQFDALLTEEPRRQEQQEALLYQALGLGHAG